MRALLAIVFIILWAPAAFAEDSYVCIPDFSTGFFFDQNAHSWRPTTFSIKGRKYLLARQKGKLFWREFRQNSEPEPCDEFNEVGYTFCRGLEEVVVNRTNLRFQAYYYMGYTYGNSLPSNPEGSDTPNIEIGTCSPFSN